MVGARTRGWMMRRGRGMPPLHPSAPPPEVLSLADASFDTGRRDAPERPPYRWPDYVYRVLH